MFCRSMGHHLLSALPPALRSTQAWEPSPGHHKGVRATGAMVLTPLDTPSTGCRHQDSLVRGLVPLKPAPKEKGLGFGNLTLQGQPLVHSTQGLCPPNPVFHLKDLQASALRHKQSYAGVNWETLKPHCSNSIQLFS